MIAPAKSPVRRWPATALVLLLAPLLFSSARAPDSPTVRIGVFGLFRPQELVLRAAPGTVVTLEIGGEVFSLAGEHSASLMPREGKIECHTNSRRAVGSALRASSESGEFRLGVPGKIERRYHGSLEVTSIAGVLQPVVTMGLEVAVASAVAAESPPGAPLEALKAQAVVTRSYYVAGRGRHEGFDFCDTTHCQFLRQPPEEDDAAWLATAATRGLVLSYEGKALPALYSASCGGRTRTLAQAGMRSEGYPYFSVACPEHAESWERRLEAADAAPLASGTKQEAGRINVARRLGWSAVPSNNYTAEQEHDHILLRGRGLGHGVGLCQRGAAHMAAQGAGFLQILSYYYPNTAVGH